MANLHIHGGDVYRYPHMLDFSANCNPYGMPEGVKKAAKEAVEKADCYPDVECTALRKALSLEEQVPMEQIICGNGAADYGPSGYGLGFLFRTGTGIKAEKGPFASAFFRRIRAGVTGVRV